MTLDYPTWLNEEFVRKVLRLSEKDDSIEVISMDLSPATKPGDNYSSLMFRAKTEFKREDNVTRSKSLVIKVKPGPDSDLLNVYEMFAFESAMMMDTLNKMNELLNDGSALSAKAFYSQDKNPIILVLEDLIPKGFRMSKHKAELDAEHLILAIRNIARFHASSVALAERDQSAVEKYNKGFYHADQLPGFWKYFEKSINDVAKNMADSLMFEPRYVEKIANLEACAVKKAIEVTARREGDFSVLCHGDLWPNNMLYRYDDNGKPIDHIFVDFQMPVYTSPAYDIIYFFGTSLRNDDARENLLIDYHKTLESTMSKLNCKTATPSLDGLKKILKDRGFFEVVINLLALPIILQNEEIKDLGNVDINIDNLDISSMRSKIYLNILKRRIPRWDEAGLLDIE